MKAWVNKKSGGVPVMDVKIEIFVIEKEPIVHEGWKHICDGTTDIAYAGGAESSKEGLDAIRSRPEDYYDVIVMDIALPGDGGLGLLRKIRTIRRNLPLLVVTGRSEEDYGVRVLRGGGSGFIKKSEPVEEMVEAIRKVYSGGKHLSTDLGEALAVDVDVSKEKKPHMRLSGRETQVLQRLASGKTVGEIADDIGVSRKTITTFRSRILKKMHLKNNAELIRYVITHGLLE